MPDTKTEGLSHEIGSGQLIEGLDDAIIGLTEGETRVFTTTLAAGEHAGKEAQVTVTVANTAPPVPSGLVGAWGFNEGSGSVVAD